MSLFLRFSFQPFFVERVFHIFDKDDNGSISLQEFIDAMHQFAGQSPDDKIKFLFKVYDIDGNVDVIIIYWVELFMSKKININTVKPVYNDHPRDPKIVAVVDRWSLFRGHLCQKKIEFGPQNLLFINGCW